MYRDGRLRSFFQRFALDRGLKAAIITPIFLKCSLARAAAAQCCPQAQAWLDAQIDFELDPLVFIDDEVLEHFPTL